MQAPQPPVQPQQHQQPHQPSGFNPQPVTFNSQPMPAPQPPKMSQPSLPPAPLPQIPPGPASPSVYSPTVASPTYNNAQQQYQSLNNRNSYQQPQPSLPQPPPNDRAYGGMQDRAAGYNQPPSSSGPPQLPSIPSFSDPSHPSHHSPQTLSDHPAAALASQSNPPPAAPQFQPVGSGRGGSTVFGVNLDTLFKRDQSPVPLVVYQCIQAVDLFGLDIEGIYRYVYCWKM